MAHYTSHKPSLRVTSSVRWWPILILITVIYSLEVRPSEKAKAIGPVAAKPKESLKSSGASSQRGEQCVDESRGTVKNGLKVVKESTGNSDHFQKYFQGEITPKVFKSTLLEMAQNILNNGGRVTPELREEFLSLLDQYQKEIMEGQAKEVFQIQSKGQPSEQERERLTKIRDEFLYDLKDEPLNELWKVLAEKVDDKHLSSNVKKLVYFSEYLYKLSGEKGRTSHLRIKLEGMSASNRNQTFEGLKKYIFGDPSQTRRSLKDGAMGQFERDYKSIRFQVKRKQEILLREEKLQEKDEEENERIEEGEVLSDRPLKKAKFHHGVYKKLYRIMLEKCRVVAYRQTQDCELAKKRFKNVGVKIHLKKMFDFIDETNRLRKKEKSYFDKTKKMREEYLGEDYGELEQTGGMIQGSERDYSLFDSESSYGEYASGFARALPPNFGAQFPIYSGTTAGGTPGRLPGGVNPTMGGSLMPPPYGFSQPAPMRMSAGGPFQLFNRQF